MFRFVLCIAIGLMLSVSLSAATFEITEPDTSIIGHNMVLYSHSEDTLLDIARQFDLGYRDITDANPEVDVWLPGDNTAVVLPTRFILPDAPKDGIVINIAEMRLFYYPKTALGKKQQVVTHPIGIGREGWATPLGKTRIIQKIKAPTWTPPESIRNEYAEKGEPLPLVVPAGPDNPLGAYAMRLSMPGYLLHGTNKPYGVGLRVSHGCIRLFPEDIENMFNITPSNTPVEIVYQPHKAGMRSDKLYLEAHREQRDVHSIEGNNMTSMVEAILGVQGKLPDGEHWSYTETVVRQQHGVVKPIGQHIDIIRSLWFLHSGLNKKAVSKVRAAMTELQLEELYWPVRYGAREETLIGPFNTQSEAKLVADKIAAIAGVSIWTVQISNDAL